MENRPNIFGYNDFRKFLGDYFASRRHVDKGFNKAYICRELGLPNTRSYFQDVLNGKFVSDVKLPLFIKLLALDQNESQYFRVAGYPLKYTDSLLVFVNLQVPCKLQHEFAPLVAIGDKTTYLWMSIFFG